MNSSIAASKCGEWSWSLTIVKTIWDRKMLSSPNSCAWLLSPLPDLPSGPGEREATPALGFPAMHAGQYGWIHEQRRRQALVPAGPGRSAIVHRRRGCCRHRLAAREKVERSWALAHWAELPNGMRARGSRSL